MRRHASIAGVAGATTLLLHAVLLGGLSGMHFGDAREPATVFEARVIAGPPPEPMAPRPAPPVVPPQAPAAPAPPAEAPMPQATPSETPATESAQSAAPLAAAPLASKPPAGADASAPPDFVVSAEAPPPQQAAESAPEATKAPPLNPLPANLDLRYSVHYGFATGEQRLVWARMENAYTLTSEAVATGLAGVFYRGRFAQTSRGRVTPQGLEPEEFQDQRGNAHANARFDVIAGQVTLHTARGEVRHYPYRPGMQDILSLFFQLALTAPPPAGQMQFAVFNGRRVREYTFIMQGEAMLDTALGPLRTLHLVRTDHPEDRFEAWLAIDRHHLPVRVLSRDGNDQEMELRIERIAH